MIFGAVWQTYKNKRKHIRKAHTLLKTGDFIECYFDPKIDLNQTFEFEVLYETKQYGIYHKPVGALSEGTNHGDKTSLFRHVEKSKKYAYLVNRLDRETEGLVVVAYNSKAQNSLQQIWRTKVIKKYQAIVLGEMQENSTGEFNYPLNDKFSLTKYKCIQAFGDRSYLEIELATERKHQVRIHLSKAGNPVMGDPIYGEHNKNKDGLMLISYYLEFKDPCAKNNLVQVSLPENKLLF
jgi:tRNA pseudouridine32 synthase / 23S rRNA pseudouridine746 synthase